MQSLKRNHFGKGCSLKLTLCRRSRVDNGILYTSKSFFSYETCLYSNRSRNHSPLSYLSGLLLYPLTHHYNGISFRQLPKDYPQYARRGNIRPKVSKVWLFNVLPAYIRFLLLPLYSRPKRNEVQESQTLTA